VIDAALVARKALLITRDLASLAPLAPEGARRLSVRPAGRAGGRAPAGAHHRTHGRRELSADRDGSCASGRLLRLVRAARREGVYDAEFGRRIAACAGLRNRIIHEYDEIEPRVVHEALRSAMRDLPAYLRAVDAYVQRVAVADR
jgi:hypothetical protein